MNDRPKLTPEMDEERCRIIENGLVFGGSFGGMPEGHAISHYKGLLPSAMKELVEKGYADPEGTQNDSPELGEILSFCEKHPGFTMFGYIVSRDRRDCRVTVEGVCGKPGCLDHDGVDEFVELFRFADSFSLDGANRSYYAWYD